LQWSLGLLASWSAYVIGYPIPIGPISATFLFCALYNSAFAVWERVRPAETTEAGYAVISSNGQFTLDFIALFIIIYLTGGFFSPVVIFIFFHVMLTGILLPPSSCYVYSLVVLVVIGFMIILEITQILPPYPPLLQYPFLIDRMHLRDIAAAYIVFSTAVMVTAYLITSLKVSLRTKGRELLTVSKALEISNTKLRALYEMVKEMNTCATLQSLADCAVRNAAVIMGVKACSIKLLDDQRRYLKFVSVCGLSTDYTEKGPIDIEKSPVNLQVIEGGRLSIGSIDEKETFQYPEDIRKENIASMICLPLRVEKMIIGVFCVYSSDTDFFSARDADFFSLMADLTAIGIANIKNQENRTWFLHKAAHQLRAPLNASFSMLDIMDKGYLGEVNIQQEEMLNRTKTRIRLLGDMVGDLLKIGIKRVTLPASDVLSVDVKRKMKEVAGLYMAGALEKNIRFQFKIDETIPEIKADPQVLDNLFSNLVSNAIKYTPAGGDVTARLAMEGKDTIRLDVVDTGIGIPGEDFSNVFNEFYRSENARVIRIRGQGWGLSLSRRLSMS
jgi:K+-sensing histidine kinase KdpD